MFEPQAAAQLLAQLLGDNLEVPRKPLAEPGRAVNFLPSELETKIGSRILPDWIDVTDDPTQTTLEREAAGGLRRGSIWKAWFPSRFRSSKREC